MQLGQRENAPNETSAAGAPQSRAPLVPASVETSRKVAAVKPRPPWPAGVSRHTSRHTPQARKSYLRRLPFLPEGRRHLENSGQGNSRTKFHKVPPTESRLLAAYLLAFFLTVRLSRIPRGRSLLLVPEMCSSSRSWIPRIVDSAAFESLYPQSAFTPTASNETCSVQTGAEI
jgi:hypothetical protein